MTAHDPRVTLTEAELTYGRTYPNIGDRGRWYSEGSVREIIAARLAPIRALADDAAALYDDRLAEVAALPPGSVGRRLHSMLGDLAHAALDAPVSASQDHDGAEGQGEPCDSRGPRIGEDGCPRCRFTKGHSGVHRATPEDGWGEVSWGLLMNDGTYL